MKPPKLAVANAVHVARAAAAAAAARGLAGARLRLARARAEVAARVPARARAAAARLARTRPGLHARARVRLALGALFVGACVALARPAPPPKSPAGVAALLGAAAARDVSADAYVWQRSGGVVADGVAGRHVVFVGRDRAGSGDVYRARVRLTPGGRPLGVRELRALAASPFGDERDLVASDDRVAFATFDGGRAHSITVLDFANDEARRDAAAKPLGARVAARLERFFGVGADLGFAETDVRLEGGVAALRFELGPSALVMALGDEGTPASLTLPASRTSAVVSASLDARDDASAPVVARWVPADERAPGALADRLALEALGHGAARTVLAVSVRVDALRARSRRARGGPAGAVAPTEAPTGAFPPPVDGATWWPFTRALPAGDAASSLVRTTTRAAGGAAVTLVAVDARRARVGVEAGLVDGVRERGARGRGEPPRGALFVFNAGAPPAASTSGVAAPGLFASGRFFQQAALGDPTVAVCDTPLGPRVAFGAWAVTPGCGVDAALGASASASTLRGLVQAPPPAAEACPGCAVARSALCATRGGQLVYAWSPAASRDEIATSLDAAGCAHAQHLGARADATGFAWLRRDAPAVDAALDASARPVAVAVEPAMPIERLAFPARSAFFFVEAVSPAPRTALPKGAAWRLADFVQPSAPDVPASYRAEFTAVGTAVVVHALAPGRFAFRVEPGSDEIRPKIAGFLAPRPTSAKPLLALSLGTATAKRKGGPRGLALAGVVGLPVHDHGAVLVVERPDVAGARALRLERSDDFVVPPGADVVELPLAADQGRIGAEARRVDRTRDRGALCLLGDGALLVATARFDSDEPTTQALVDLGCARVATLDRGAETDAFVKGATSSAALEVRFAETALVAFEAPLRVVAGPLVEASAIGP